MPHLVVMLFAEPEELEAWQQSVTGALFHGAFHEVGRLDTSNLGGREHFGFIDGISQPQLDWNRTRAVSVNSAINGRLTAMWSSSGEFLIGHPNG